MATPPSGVTAENLFHASFPIGLGSTELEGTDFTVRRIEIEPGGTTGWHYHDGPVYAYVETGTLTRVLHDCSVETTGPGGLVEEDVGSDRPHEGVNGGPGALVLLAAYVEPPGDPFAEDAPDPGC
ncbi:cupin domain-containing protein [Rhodococcus sp. NPDC058521]|uniref:cupin domain-containing protein n=1 Tax=Rhodococcus sp. NPDC058521 TaxID=3346536 RepID=UPI003649ACEC